MLDPMIADARWYAVVGSTVKTPNKNRGIPIPANMPENLRRVK